MQPDEPLPPFSQHGYLPEGVHEATLEQMQERFVINPQRTVLWERLQAFLAWVVSTGKFSHVYIDGGFITGKASPEDIDVILQTSVHYGPEAFSAMEPFFVEGLDNIREKFSVHLHFWCEGFPGGLSDFRRFFQYLRPGVWSTLTPQTRQQVRSWLERPVLSDEVIELRGRVRAIDLDLRRFDLRRIDGGSRPDLRCIYSAAFDLRAKKWLDGTVNVRGQVETYQGAARLLQVQDVEEVALGQAPA